jgi:hypothetical protein
MQCLVCSDAYLLDLKVNGKYFDDSSNDMKNFDSKSLDVLSNHLPSFILWTSVSINSLQIDSRLHLIINERCL